MRILVFWFEKTQVVESGTIFPMHYPFDENRKIQKTQSYTHKIKYAINENVKDSQKYSSTNTYIYVHVALRGQGYFTGYIIPEILCIYILNIYK